MRESEYQAYLVRKFHNLFPGCFVIPNDPTRVQGVPDLLILFGPMWAMVEVKTDADAAEQPNQRYYVEMFDNMSFAAFIHPEIESEVIYAIQQAFGTVR